jgi:hypothetical protein
VRAIDRDNVGHVLTIDDTAGTCLVQFDSIDGRTATKTLDWSNSSSSTTPTRRDHPPPPPQPSPRRTEQSPPRQAWATALAEHGCATGDADLYRRATHTALDQAAHQLRADPPEWLTTWLGHRPTTPAAATVWDDAVTRIAHHRLLHDIPKTNPGSATTPTDPIESPIAGRT